MHDIVIDSKHGNSISKAKKDRAKSESKQKKLKRVSSKAVSEDTTDPLEKKQRLDQY